MSPAFWQSGAEYQDPSQGFASRPPYSAFPFKIQITGSASESVIQILRSAIAFYMQITGSVFPSEMHILKLPVQISLIIHVNPPLDSHVLFNSPSSFLHTSGA